MQACNAEGIASEAGRAHLDAVPHDDVTPCKDAAQLCITLFILDILQRSATTHWVVHQGDGLGLSDGAFCFSDAVFGLEVALGGEDHDVCALIDVWQKTHSNTGSADPHSDGLDIHASTGLNCEQSDMSQALRCPPDRRRQGKRRPLEGAGRAVA